MAHLFQLSERVQLLPVIHGSGHFTREVRERLLSSGCDCLAVCLPPEFQSTVEQGIQKLPYITISSLDESEGSMSYVPIDPVQPVIMALRIAQQEGLPRKFIDLSVPEYEVRHFSFPDSFALRGLSLEKFAATILPFIERPKAGNQHDQRARWMAYQLHQLEMDYRKVVLVCSFLDWPWIKQAYDERSPYPQPESAGGYPNLYGLEPNTLFFALSEFPYITYLYEKSWQELKSDRAVAIDGVKEIMLKARENFLGKHKIRYHNLTSQTFQIYLQYVRNLTLFESRLTPDLYTLAVSAKQIGGDSYAIALMEAARSYPFQEDDLGMDKLALGIDQAVHGGDEVMNAKNRLSDTQFHWRTLDLKPDPERFQQEQWKYTWNPYGQCSWPPEDEKIESLNTHIREQSKLLLSNDLARTEKFTSSVKDGIDIRDTLRNWHTGDIYVKEIPPSRGTIEVVVMLFEMEPHPDQYSWRQTWYAEHKEESTLCFFATNYMDNMIGPGIGQSTYGGCMMIFPPRPIYNIWEDPNLFLGETLEEKLLEAAFYHSQERHVTVVSPGPPKARWRRLARQYRKRIIHIPLKRFSVQTVEKVRRFHVLNGKNIRSFATRFIQDI